MGHEDDLHISGDVLGNYSKTRVISSVGDFRAIIATPVRSVEDIGKSLSMFPLFLYNKYISVTR